MPGLPTVEGTGAGGGEVRVTARTPEGDALYERVLAELDAEAVAEAIDTLPEPRAGTGLEARPDGDPDAGAGEGDGDADGGTAGGGLVPAGPVLTGEVVDVRVEALPLRGRRRAWAVLVPAVLAVACLGAAVWSFPTARTEPVPGAAADDVTDVVVQTEADRLTAQAQSALDRVLGEGHAVVTVAAEYADPSERWSERFGPTAVPTAEATATATDGAGGRYDARVTNNGVDRSVEHVVGGGRVTRLSVAVMVDASLQPPPSVATVRSWIGPAVGLQPSRGDRVSVLALPFTSDQVPLPGASPATRVVQPAVRDYAGTVTAGLLALLLLGTAVRSATRGRGSARRAGSRRGVEPLR